MQRHKEREKALKEAKEERKRMKQANRVCYSLLPYC
jgi:hypothetical protein